MKTFVFFLAVVAVASAQHGYHHRASPSTSPTHAAGAPAGGRAGAGVGGFPAYKPVNYGPKVYGRGALNQFALPPNPFMMNRALAIVNQFPGSLVRLDLDGEIVITDRYGTELEAVGPYGQEIDLEF